MTEHQQLRAMAWVTLVVSGVVALVLLLWPSGDQVRTIHIDVWSHVGRALGYPGWFTPEVLEQVANTFVLLVPMAAIAILARRVPAWVLILVSAPIGAVVEVVQWAFLAERLPDVVDAVFNGVGAVLGVWLGKALLRWVDARDEGRRRGSGAGGSGDA